MATFEALALVTNGGKARLAQMLATGKSFVVDRFVIGDQGHDPLDPTIAITPDPARTVCYGSVFTDLIDGVSFSSSTCPVFLCNVLPGEATGVVSSICLIGTIVYSPIVGDPDIGLQFLFAIANYPLKIKTPTDTFEYEVFIQF